MAIMKGVQNIYGMNKTLFMLWVKARVFFYFFPRVLTGKIRVKAFVRFQQRLLFFLKAVQENKFVKIGKVTKLGLYIPGFPSRAFFTACQKFSVFDKKLPCTTVLISVTSACRFRCGHCYQNNDKGKDVELPFLVETATTLQDMGMAFFNIEGGEPFRAYDRLLALCQALDDRSEIWINSTGDGMDLAGLKRLRQTGAAAIMFSLHSPTPDGLNRFMGRENAWQTMEKGVELCHQAGIAVTFNSCLSVEDFSNGQFEAVMDRAKDFGAAMVQLIKPKSAGAWLDGGASPFSAEDLDVVKEKVHRFNHHRDFRQYPAISAQIIEEDRNLFGCTAGGTDRFYINAKGDVQPCEFLNISFGNISGENFLDIYKRMRRTFEEPGDCWLCEKYSKRISDEYKRLNLKSLPLDKTQSRVIYQSWNRGGPTPLYMAIEKDMRL